MTLSVMESVKFLMPVKDKQMLQVKHEFGSRFDFKTTISICKALINQIKITALSRYVKTIFKNFVNTKEINSNWKIPPNSC